MRTRSFKCELRCCKKEKKIITRHIYEATQDIKVEMLKRTKHFFARTCGGILKSKDGESTSDRH